MNPLLPDTNTWHPCIFIIPKFSKMAYHQQTISEEEIQQSLDLALINWSPPQEQIKSPFLQFPVEIKNLIFNSMESLTLKRCLLVCKEFSKLATPNYIQIALTEDFKNEETAIDKQLDKYTQPDVDSASETVAAEPPTYSSKLEAAAKRINTFKSLCLFLYNNCELNADADRQKVKLDLTSTMKLQKACLKEQENARSEEQALTKE